MNNKNPINEIVKHKIVSVIRAESAQEAIEKVEAIAKGGIKVFEITVDQGKILPAIKELNQNKELTIMAGGIITSMRAQECINLGAKVIVSPVLQGHLLKFCLGHKTPHIATVSTPNEAYNAWKLRIPIIKIFPAKSMGQVEYIEDILRPMPFLNLMPSGGITIDDFTQYLKAGATAVGIGRSLYKNANSLSEITERAKYAISQLQD